jgi:hypothetical protein
MQKSSPLTVPHSLGAHHRKTRRRHNVAISGTCISMSPCYRHPTCVSSCTCKGIIMQLAATTPWGVHHNLCRGLAGWVMDNLSCTEYTWSSQPLARRERPSDLESPARLCWALLRSQLLMSPGAQHTRLSQAATYSRLGILVGFVTSPGTPGGKDACIKAVLKQQCSCCTCWAASPVLKIACGWGLAAACPTVCPSAVISSFPSDTCMKVFLTRKSDIP